MPPKYATKQAVMPVQDEDNGSATLPKRMQQSKDRRKEEKRSQLRTKFDSDMAEAERKVEATLATAAEECVTVRVGLTARLMEAFKKRGDIEQQIITHLRTLEQAYSTANTELRVVLNGKLDDIEQGPVVPKPTQPTG